jgi:ATPase subunit of ABC transporter with duplicated ATPase domains
MPLVLPLVEVQSVSEAFPRHAGMRTTDQTVVDNVSFEIEAGETLGLVGDCGHAGVARRRGLNRQRPTSAAVAQAQRVEMARKQPVKVSDRLAAKRAPKVRRPVEHLLQDAAEFHRAWDDCQAFHHQVAASAEAAACLSGPRVQHRRSGQTWPECQGGQGDRE